MASARPSTSGGLSASRGTNFDKRMSKDDMFFNNGSRREALAKQTVANNRMSKDDMYIRSQMAAMSQFHIPVLGSHITPEHSPDYPVAHEVSIPVRMQTPESMTSGEIPIGMALGSPTHMPPDPSRWHAQFPPASPPTRVSGPSPAPTVGGAAAAASNESLQRKKTGRRKLFGLFGGGRKDDQAQRSAGRERAQTVASKSPMASTTTVTVQPPKTPTRSNTHTDTRASRHKPLMSRSNTMPHNTPDEPPIPQLRAQDLASRAMDPHMRPGRGFQQSPPRLAPKSFLDVQIPDTKLERYSVMFSDVLNKDSRHEPAASLLARRQVTVERLKTINQGMVLEVKTEDQDQGRQRRATSPQPMRETASPRLSVFPIPPTNRIVPLLETPTSKRVARSNTSPGRLPSPTHQAFDVRQRMPPASGPSRNLEVPNPVGMHPPSSSGLGRQQEPIYPTDTSFRFGPDESGLVLDSPISMDSPQEIVVAQPLRPTLHEPQWQMISPTTTTAASSVAGGISTRRGRSPSAASSSTHVTKPSSSSADLDASSLSSPPSSSSGAAAHQSAVEVSIARQISISRQQRNLLRPLQTRRATNERQAAAAAAAGGGDSGPQTPTATGPQGRSPLGVTVVKTPSPSRLGRSEPIKDVQSSTPTLVHQWESPVRKSSWAVVEGD